MMAAPNNPGSRWCNGGIALKACVTIVAPNLKASAVPVCAVARLGILYMMCERNINEVNM